MNDLFYEIIMQSSVLITGLANDKTRLLYNLFLTIFGLFELPELHIIDLAGQSSKYGRFSPAVYDPHDAKDLLYITRSKMCSRINANTRDAKPIFIFVNNHDSFIRNYHGKDKKPLSISFLTWQTVDRRQICI